MLKASRTVELPFFEILMPSFILIVPFKKGGIDKEGGLFLGGEVVAEICEGYYWFDKVNSAAKEVRLH